MNVYDFDKTILDGDSTFCFYRYCVKKKPSILWSGFRLILPLALYLLGFLSKTRFKEKIFVFMQKVDCLALLPDFWKENTRRVKAFYREKHREDDVIVTASPEFLVRPCAEALGVRHLIGSVVDPKTGKFTGENCWGEEKVRRFEKAGFDKTQIEEFYSDSLSDAPLARLAKEAYVVTGEKLAPWDEYRLPFGKKVLKTFLDPTFFRFAVCGTINTVTCVLFGYLASLGIADIKIAHLLGYYLSISLSYFINSLFSFQRKLSVPRYFKFILSYVPNYLVQLVVVFLFCDVMHLHKLVGLVAAAAIGAPVTFLCMKFFAFRK